ncbi:MULTISPECIES: phosphonate C-P lyase system protein PhnG [Rahnella]|uniref:phosphonate C-P lyase system protein PhnG n=1 Tax=Rahnella TaxID=34037 RepID=UPI0006F2A9E0|nr:MULTISPECIES: phosphonate C-P lyase system protein PhnG [Rahnella]KQN47142.1 phosphonate C-P lyase system protein PhnG [Serratia sp. Leaf51]MBU9830248.1 phosphonate C-P lyase system protein PhnG [Rahnella rivi]THD53661.1 phosphonate C-P lyase system protein PhnG [Enterobacteriaceae bacterium ML5]
MDHLQTRQRWMSVLAHSRPDELLAHWQTLNLSPQFERIRAAETGLTQLQGRMGGTGKRFVMGDMTITRAVIQLDGGVYGYSYVSGRNKPHAELCAVIDALLQMQGMDELLHKRVIAPLAALQQERRQQRAREVASSRVDFFTLVRGE